MPVTAPMAIEAEALLALSEKASQGEWLLRGRFISAPSTNPCIPGQDVIVSTSYSDRRIEEDEANVAFIAALVSAYRDGSLIHRSALAEDTARAAEGWKALPPEPTEEMGKAYTEAFWRKMEDMRSPSPTEHPEDGGGPFGYAYRAMLAASPALPLDKEAAHVER